MSKRPPLKPIDTPYCTHCKNAIRSDVWYREREDHMVASFEKGYGFIEIAAAYNRPPQWVQKTITETYGKAHIGEVMRTRAASPEFLEEGQIPATLEEHEYDGQDSDTR